jgi:hypothetical protein
LSSVYLEFTVQGTCVKVAAIDPQSGLEVSFLGPAGTPRSELERLALQKLDYALRKKRQSKKSRPGALA